MQEKEIPRLSRLTALLILLQSRKRITANDIARRFNISIRTAYRDIRALEEAGVPIIIEEGKGYTLMEGYLMPPVMFSETEANALVTAEQLVATNKDASFVKNYADAVTKIKAVLKYTIKNKAELLSQRIHFHINPKQETTSNHLSAIQLAITNFSVIHITYSSENEELTRRYIEPLGLYSTRENWILIAFCRMRNENRAFRLDRILQLQTIDEVFAPNAFTLQQYFEECKNAAVPLT